MYAKRADCDIEIPCNLSKGDRLRLRPANMRENLILDLLPIPLCCLSKPREIEFWLPCIVLGTDPFRLCEKVSQTDSKPVANMEGEPQTWSSAACQPIPRRNFAGADRCSEFRGRTNSGHRANVSKDHLWIPTQRLGPLSGSRNDSPEFI